MSVIHQKQVLLKRYCQKQQQYCQNSQQCLMIALIACLFNLWACVDPIMLSSFKEPTSLTEEDFNQADRSGVLALRVVNQAGKEQLCTATLIDQKHIVTSASCFSQAIQYVELYASPNAQGIVSTTLSLIPQRIWIHPDYAMDPFQKDIAILEVKEDDRFLTLINPIALSQSKYAKLINSKIYQIAYRLEGQQSDNHVNADLNEGGNPSPSEPISIDAFIKDQMINADMRASNMDILVDTALQSTDMSFDHALMMDFEIQKRLADMEIIGAEELQLPSDAQVPPRLLDTSIMDSFLDQALIPPSIMAQDMGNPMSDMSISMTSEEAMMIKKGDIVQVKLFEQITQINQALIIDEQVKEKACVLNKGTAILSMEAQKTVLVGFLNQGTGICLDGMGIPYQEIGLFLKTIESLPPDYSQENGKIPTQLSCKIAMLCKNFPCTQLVKAEDKMKLMALNQCLQANGCDKFNFQCAQSECQMQYQACEAQ